MLPPAVQALLDATGAELPIDLYGKPWPWPFTVADAVQVWASSATVTEFAARLEIDPFVAIGVATLCAWAGFEMQTQPGRGISSDDLDPSWSRPVSLAADGVDGFVLATNDEREATVKTIARFGSVLTREPARVSAHPARRSRIVLTQRVRAWLRFVSAWTATADAGELGMHYGHDMRWPYPVRVALSAFARRVRADGVRLPRRDWEIGASVLPSEARLVEEFRQREEARAAILPQIPHREALAK